MKSENPHDFLLQKVLKFPKRSLELQNLQKKIQLIAKCSVYTKNTLTGMNIN